MTNTITPTINAKTQAVIDQLDSSYDLIYVDYRDDLDGNIEELNTAISLGYEAFDNIWDHSYDQSYDTAVEVLNSISGSDELNEDDRDEVLNAIRDRDNSDPIGDLLKNTAAQVYAYNTGITLGYEDWNSYPSDYYQAMRKLKSTLKIAWTNKTWDNELDLMLRQNGSGDIILYFYDRPRNWIGITGNSINFNGTVAVGIIDYGQGGGDSCYLRNFNLTLPFNIDNLFLDKVEKYNWTYSICGMSSDWCEGSKVTLSDEKIGKINATNQAQRLAQEAGYKATYVRGSCTFGDMDLSRHRNAPYINQYPCGNHCKDCQTFWID